MKLHGEQLQAEIAQRRQAKESRRKQRTTLRARAKELDIDVMELSAWERGEDICPHEEYKPTVAGVPIPKLVLEQCTVCGHIKNVEAISDDNMEKAYEGFQNLD